MTSRQGVGAVTAKRLIRSDFVGTPLCIAEQARVRPLWTFCLAFCNGTVPKVVYQATFARLPGDDPRDFTCLGAEREGRLIGLTHGLSQRHARKVEERIYRRIFMLFPTCAARADRGGLCGGGCDRDADGLPAEAGFQPPGAAVA